MPSPGSPQSFNRFSYVKNNPLRYTDPSGYTKDAAGGGAPPPTAEETAAYILSRWGIEIIGDWTVLELDWVIAGLVKLTDALGGETAFKEALGINAGKSVTFARGGESPISGDPRYIRRLSTRPKIADSGAIAGDRSGYAGTVITFYDQAFSGDKYEAAGNPAWTAYVVIHELAHVMDSFSGGAYSAGLMNVTGSFYNEHGYVPGGGDTTSQRSYDDHGEDWAESFAAYLCPDVGRFQAWRRRPSDQARRLNYAADVVQLWREWSSY